MNSTQILAKCLLQLRPSTCLYRKAVAVVPTRHCSSDSVQHKSSWFAQPMRQPPNAKLVYLGPKNNLVGAIKAFSLTSTAIGLGVQAFVLTAGKGGPTDLILVGGLALFSATPLLLHLLTSSYVFWLYATDEGKFVAMTKSIFLYNRRYEFNADQVSLTDTGIPFANLKANGKKLFIDPAFSLDFNIVEQLFRFKQ